MKPAILGHPVTQILVAPLAGAWIETVVAFELKRIVDVAPLAGAWIETGRTEAYPPKASGRPPRGGVD